MEDQTQTQNLLTIGALRVDSHEKTHQIVSLKAENAKLRKQLIDLVSQNRSALLNLRDKLNEVVWDTIGNPEWTDSTKKSEGEGK